MQTVHSAFARLVHERDLGEFMICKNCGKELRDGTRICYYCSEILINDDDIIDSVLSGAKEKIEGVDYSIASEPLQRNSEQSADTHQTEQGGDTAPIPIIDTSRPNIVDAIMIEEDPNEYSPEAIAAKKAAQRVRDNRRLNFEIVLFLIASALFFWFLCSFYNPIVLKSPSLEAAAFVNPIDLVAFEKNAQDRYTYTVFSSELISDKPGTYTIDYAVTKTSTGKTHMIDYAVTVIDTTPPEINISDTVTLTNGTPFDIADYASVSDNSDEIGTDRITVSGNYDTSEDGTYPLTLSVTDASGNTEIKSIALIVKGLTDEQRFYKQISGIWYNGSTYLTFGEQNNQYTLSISSLIYQPSGSLNYVYVNPNLNAAAFSWEWSYSLLNHTMSGTKNIFVDMGSPDDGKMMVDLGDGFGYSEYSMEN